MSKHDKIAKLKEYVKNFVIKELEKDEELEEVSTTATAGIDGTGTGHYDTPRAFSAPTSGSQGGHPKPDVVGYKKVNESMELKKLEDAILMFQKKIKKQGRVTNTRDEDHLKNLIKVYKQMGGRKIKESINESYGEMMDELEKIYRPSGAPPIAKEALKDLADEYDIGRVLYAARTNKKSFIEVLDMKIDQLQSQYVNKKHINTIKRGKKLKEATKQEVNALKKFIRDFDKMQKQYWNIAKMGDKELTNSKYNKHYETILAAQKSIVQLAREIQEKERVGEGLNEGRYHQWRNDESLSPKQKIGRSMREVRDSLNGLSKTIDMSVKLKNELKVDTTDYWKTTHKALGKISERLVKLANKVGKLQ